jgi:DNA-binding protein YbaB
VPIQSVVLKEIFMEKKHVKAAGEHGKGPGKEITAAVTGDKRLRAVKFDETKGSPDVAGDLKDLARHAVKTAKHRFKADMSPSDVDIPGDD